MSHNYRRKYCFLDASFYYPDEMDYWDCLNFLMHQSNDLQWGNVTFKEPESARKRELNKKFILYFFVIQQGTYCFGNVLFHDTQQLHLHSSSTVESNFL